MEDRVIRYKKFVHDLKKLIKEHNIVISFTDNYDDREYLISTSYSFMINGNLVPKDLHEFLIEDVGVKRTGGSFQ